MSCLNIDMLAASDTSAYVVVVEGLNLAELYEVLALAFMRCISMTWLLGAAKA